MSQGELVKLAAELRALGVRRFRYGDFECEFSPRLPEAAAPEFLEPVESRLDREHAEYMRDLLHSAG